MTFLSFVKFYRKGFGDYIQDFKTSQVAAFNFRITSSINSTHRKFLLVLDQKVVINFFFSNKNRHPKYSNRSSSWWATLKECLTRAVSLNYDSATRSAHALLVQDLKAVFSKGMLTFCCGDIRVLSVALVYNSSVFFLLECNFFSSIRDSTSSLSGGHHSLQKILQYLMNMDKNFTQLQ